MLCKCFYDKNKTFYDLEVPIFNHWPITSDVCSY
jgi:hypothetical protein